MVCWEEEMVVVVVEVEKVFETGLGADMTAYVTGHP